MGNFLFYGSLAASTASNGRQNDLRTSDVFITTYAQLYWPTNFRLRLRFVHLELYSDSSAIFVQQTREGQVEVGSVAYWVSEQLIRNLSMVISSYYELATYLYIPIAIYLCYLSCIIYLMCCRISSTSLEGPATN
jgi:hypothetical protein